LPWDVHRTVEIPGTGIRIQGHIDRLDLASEAKRARVIDYKTGRLNKDMATVVLKGGSELQRCLYAFAVKTLLGPNVQVDAALLYPIADDNQEALYPLRDVDAVLAQLATAINRARRKINDGLLLPGIDADNQFNDFAFAFPASPSYLPRKMPLAHERLGDAVAIWEEP
jgi:PD-(D/E)XK nuclease superfamily